MACEERIERFTQAVIDADDMTVTEFSDDCVRTYDIMEILQRWSNIPDVTVTIERRIDLPPTEER